MTHYDPALRKSLGVFYTPHKVVGYLITMVDKALVEDFGIQGGLSNNDTMQVTVPSERYQLSDRSKKWRDTREITVPRVAVLDPACGTGTFHAEIIKYIKNTYFSGAREAFYNDYIKKEDGLLSRLIGFEIMMTSYVVAHLNVRRAIDETLGHVPETPLPTKIYLTNTLAAPNSELEQTDQMSLFDFSAAITDEAYKADTWKTRRPIKVIIGNPPYLVSSTNPFDISAYRTETDGVSRLQEKNSKMLSDYYVKFFRFAQEIIEKAGEGILAYVSPHGYLDNPTFRGMRASLLRTFDKIFVVNLHGNSNKGEVAPDGGVDENIFDIKQGIALFVGVKTTKKPEWSKIYHADLWGKRESKFLQLDNIDACYSKITPDLKMAYFIPFENKEKESYEKNLSIAEIYPINVSGVESGNDKVAITLNDKELNRRLEIVRNAINDDSILELFGKFTSSQTAEKIKSDVFSDDGITAPISFRPFDNRWAYYSGKSGGWMERPREKQTMGHLLATSISPIGKNVGIVFTKGDSTPNEFSMIFISDTIIDNRLTAAQTAGKASVAPLYLYSDIDNSWTANFNNDVLTQLTQNLTDKPSPIEVFDYIYGILYDPAYREKYNEFLKRDFPRVPIIENDDVFQIYVTAGERLRKLHLLQEKVSAKLTIEPNTSEYMEIDKIKYKDGVLHINKNKSIIGISEEVWNYRIGGYQVLDKWFKSHKGETLTIERFDHICNVTGLLAETIKVQEELRNIRRKN